MTQLFIPEIGTEIILTEDWTFDLYDETRNEAAVVYYELWDILGQLRKEYYAKQNAIRNVFPFDRAAYNAIQEPCIPVVVPKGTTLKIDRIYIRKGISEYSSVTFIMKGATPKVFMSRHGYERKCGRSIRFWARLSDVNKIQFELPQGV